MADQLPTLHASRLPWHPVMEQYGIQQTDWQALVEAVFPGARTLDSIQLALSYCKRRNLDPFKRVVHIVPVWDNEQKKYVDTIWPGIAELRTTAFRTGQYAGADPTEFGPTVEQTWQDEKTPAFTIQYPAWAQLTVYRLVGGQRVPVPGPRVYWLETYSARGRSGVPNERWRRAPFQMLEKCTEAAALRRAFPEELGDEHSHDEAGAFPHDVTPPLDETARDHPVLTGNAALRERIAPHRRVPRRNEPTEEEIAEQQARLAAVLGPDEIAKLNQGEIDMGLVDAAEGQERDREPEVPKTAESKEPTSAPSAEASEGLVVKVPRKGRGWDWPAYADEVIGLARRIDPTHMPEVRVANASMLNSLRISDRELWGRVQQQLANLERGEPEDDDDATMT